MIRYVSGGVAILGVLGLLLTGGLLGCGAGTSEPPVARPSPTQTRRPTIKADKPITPTAVPEREPTITPTRREQATGASTENNLPQTNQLQTFQIVSEKSEVRFAIDEELFGISKTVIGRTKEISGAVTVDRAAGQEPQITAIWVNARDLKTDDSFRNRALRRQILLSAKDEYQFIVFEPTAFADLPAATAMSVGEPATFRITGDLTIKGISNPVTFTMITTPTSQSELIASGQATVLRSDYGLNIPSVPGVADVSDEVQLAVEFIAVADE